MPSTESGVIHVCGLHAMPGVAARVRPSHVISLLAPGEPVETPPQVEPSHHLRVRIDDIVRAIPGLTPPTPQHVESLVEFARTWDGRRPLLIHCAAGVSRSTAAALIVNAARFDGDELEAARTLRWAAPHASPNALLISLADDLLERNGRLRAAVEAIGAADPETPPRPVSLRFATG